MIITDKAIPIIIISRWLSLSYFTVTISYIYVC